MTCTGPHKKFSENLEWKLPDGAEIDGVPGVEGIEMKNTQELAKATLTLNLTDFPTERSVSCGLNNVSVNYTICGEYMYAAFRYAHSTYGGLLYVHISTLLHAV